MPTALVYRPARQRRLDRTRRFDAAEPRPIVWIVFVVVVAALSLLAQTRSLDPIWNEGDATAPLASP